MYKKWETFNVMLEGITYESRATLESMCYGGTCYLSVDELRDLFVSLASYQWQCAYASKSFVCPSPPRYDLHALSPCVDHVRDLRDHHSS